MINMKTVSLPFISIDQNQHTLSTKRSHVDNIISIGISLPFISINQNQHTLSPKRIQQLHHVDTIISIGILSITFHPFSNTSITLELTNYFPNKDATVRVCLPCRCNEKNIGNLLIQITILLILIRFQKELKRKKKLRSEKPTIMVILDIVLALPS